MTTVRIKHAPIIEIKRSVVHGGWVVVSFPDHVAQERRRPSTTHGTFTTRDQAVEHAKCVLEAVVA